jgi:beta-1,4-N-acetylglucosaminyltransferase
MKKKKNTIKIALVCTAGGHFEQMTNLFDFYTKYNHFWITNDNAQTKSVLKNEKSYFLTSAHFKKPWTYLAHIPLIFKIFHFEKPTHILSTGSGRMGLIPFLLAKLLKIKFIYIETYSRVNNLTLFGNFILKFGHPILTQWENKYKNCTYIGPIFKSVTTQEPYSNSGDYIFVSLGTRLEPFTRLLEYIDLLIENGTIRDKVIVQSGNTKYNSEHMEIFDFCSVDKIDQLLINAKFIITQESAGLATKCLKLNKKFIVVPRDYAYGELPAKSDMKEDLQYRLEEMGYTKIALDEIQLADAIKNLDSLKTGFIFNNKKAIEKLTHLVEDL